MWILLQVYPINITVTEGATLYSVNKTKLTIQHRQINLKSMFCYVFE